MTEKSEFEKRLEQAIRGEKREKPPLDKEKEAARRILFFIGLGFIMASIYLVYLEFGWRLVLAIMLYVVGKELKS